jgi:glycyl-tRNA synthetase beta chain
MGRYYAREAGEKPAVADAARDHYSPLGPSDAVPVEPVSVAVALADKIDTLTGFWAIDEKPTGSKDPYALRRAALGVIRLVVGNGVRMGIAGRAVQRHILAVLLLLKGAEFRLHGKDLISAEAARLLTSDEMKDLVYRLVDSDDEAKEETLLARMDRIGADLIAFLHDRLKVTLRDQGVSHDIIDACLAMPGNDDLTLLVKRATALSETLKTEDGANLLQGFKRANNILAQAEAKDGVEYSFGADPKFAETDEERALFAALDTAEAKIGLAMAEEDFATAMAAMASLRAPVDAFFTAVQVNAENPIIRRNRLNLLHRIRAICSGVADLSRIEG